MTTKEKQRKHPAILLGAGIAAALLILLVIAVTISPPKPEAETVPEIMTEPAATLPPETEPTLPPPEANPYGPTDFQFDGGYLTCIAGESVLGIDVSEHQEEIKWEQVKQAGVEFVMIRVGYRGYGTAGKLCIDEAAQDHYTNAKAAGLKVGAYFFSQAVNTAEALEEARMMLELIRDWELDMPLVYDWEYVNSEARTRAVSGRDLTNITLAFCNYIRDAGYTPMIYFSLHQGMDLLSLEKLTDYDFWLAMFSDRMTFPYQVAMWQYSCTGSVPGIEGDVDLNLYFPIQE